MRIFISNISPLWTPVDSYGLLWTRMDCCMMRVILTCNIADLQILLDSDAAKRFQTSKNALLRRSFE